MKNRVIYFLLCIAMNIASLAAPVRDAGGNNTVSASTERIPKRKGGSIMTINKNGILPGNKLYNAPAAIDLSLLGCITIVSSGGDAENSTWTFDGTTISPNSATNVRLNASDVVTRLGSGSVIIAAKCITDSADVDASAAPATSSLTFKTAGTINQLAGADVITNGGNITYWANSQDTSGGRINLGGSSGNPVNVNSNGGNIVMSGGSDPSTGYATSTSGQAQAVNLYTYVNLSAGTGDVTLRGKSMLITATEPPFLYSSTVNFGIGVFLWDHATISCRNLAIDGLGSTATSNGGGHIGVQIDNSSTVTASGSISINGVGGIGSVTNNHGVWIGDATISATGSDSVNITGLGGNTNNNSNHDGVHLTGAATIKSGSGPLTLTGTKGPLTTGGQGIEIGSETPSGTVTLGDASTQYGSITLRANEFTNAKAGQILSTGLFTVESKDAAFAGNITFPFSNLSLASYLGGLTLGKSTNTTNVTIGSAITINGPVKVYGANLANNAALFSSEGSVLLKASGNVTVNGNIKTNGGNITLWSDYDESGDGGINITDNDTLDSRTQTDRNANNLLTATGGGKITLAGGKDDGGASSRTDTLYASGMNANDTIPDGYASNYRGTYNYGIGLGDIVELGGHPSKISIYSGGGDIRLHGLSSGSGYTTAVIANSGYDINAGKTGAITMLGSVINGNGSGFDLQAWRNNYTAINQILTDEGDINIIGRVNSSNSIYSLGLAIDGWENSSRTLIATTTTIPGKGNITLDGSINGSSVGWGDLRLTSVDVLAATGNIRLLGARKRFWVNAYAGNGLVVGSKASTIIPSSTSNILIQADSFYLEDPLAINTTGTVQIAPSSSRFTTGLIWNNASLSSNISGLTFGKPGNTGNIILGSSTTLSGSIRVYGGAIAINSALTSTDSSINLHATGTVTQTAPITAAGLGLHGTGTFTLTNTSNQVETLAGGDTSNASKLTSLAYAQTGNLTIGKVNPTGIHATGPVTIETTTGDIKIEQDIKTDNTSSDAIVINAGKSKTPGDGTGGNIRVSGLPAVTAGTGATIKLFSGSQQGSRGLRTVVTNASNERYLVDEGSSFSPSLSTGAYALYRGKPNNSLHFDGVDDDVRVTKNTLGNVNNTVTMEAWIYPENNTKFIQGIFAKAKDSVDGNSGAAVDCNYALLMNYGKIYIAVGNGTDYYRTISDTSVQLNTWVHVAGTYEQGVGGKIYINGNLVPSTPAGINTLAMGDLSNTAAHIGNYSFLKTNGFQGKIDELRVWNVVRTAAQIQSSLCDTLLGTETGLLAYYNFDQGVPEGNNISIDSTYDVTAGDNNGGLKNFAKTGSVSNFVKSVTEPNPGAISGDELLCIDGSTTLTSNGDAGGVWASEYDCILTVDATSGLVSPHQAGTSKVYYIVGGAGGCNKDTASFTITVLSQPVAGVAYPDTSICKGSTAGLRIVGSTGNGTLLYQWQSSANSIEGFTNVAVGSGGTTSNYTTAALTDTTYFRVWVGNGACAADTSTILAVKILEAPNAGNITSPTTYICIGNLAYLSTTGYTGTVFQWQSSSDSTSGFQDVDAETGGKVDIYSPYIIMDTTYFRVIVGDGLCAADTSLAIQIVGAPNAGVVSADTTISCGGQASLLVTGYVGDYVQWQSSTDSVSFTNISGADAASYTTGAISSTTFFRVVVSSAGECGEDISDVISVKTQDCTEFDGTVSVHSKHAGVYSDTVWVRARLVKMNKKLPVEGKEVEFRIYRGDDPAIATADVNAAPAFTDDKGFARSYIVITQDPDWNDPFNDNNGDSMHIRAYFAGDGTFGSTQKVENFNVKMETAQFESLDDSRTNNGVGVPDHKKIKFNGVLGAGYIETTNNTEDVTVQVRISEESDDMPGNITKATVRFELSPSGGGTPTYIDQHPDADGYVSATFNGVPVGSYGTNSFTVHVTVGDYYRARLNSTLTLHKKGVSSLFCGGGDILISSSSAGRYAADTGSITSFTVGSKFNKTASKVQGKASLIFTSKGRTYEVNGSGTPTVTFDSLGGVASYVSAASIADITFDTSITGSTLISPTGLTLSYNLKESNNDSVSIKVAEGATVWFTNRGAGSITDRQELISGGMAILSNIAPPIANSVSRCGPGTVTLTATPPSGATVDWYDAASGGTKLMVGSASFTVNAGSNTTYYAESRNTATSALSATRTPATVTINAQPDAPAANNGSRCGSGSVVLSATIPANTSIAWYSASTGGKALGTASSYTTPSISATTNYYVESKSTVTGCISSTRTVSTATINALPTAPVTTSVASCGPGTVTLRAATAQSNKQIEWYTVSKGGSPFSTGTSYTIASLTATTTYYTQSKDSTTGCASSARTAVTATLSSNPAAPTSITGTVSSCPSSTTALTFTAAKVTGASSYQWTKPSCATGTSTTNSISLTFSSAGVNDYVSVKAVNAYGCVSASKSVQVTTGANCNSCTAATAGLTGGEITATRSNTGSVQMNVYPNPNKGQFNLSLKGFESGPAEVRVLDVSGAVVYRVQHNLMSGLNILPLTINRTQQGVFLIQVMQNGMVRGVKMVKE